MSLYVFAQIEELIDVHVDAFLTLSAISVSLFMGLFIPIVSSILPISRALGRNLLDSLDTRSSKVYIFVRQVDWTQVKAVQFSMERAEDLTISWPVILTGN